ncbi:2-phosphosulfolactate phosphatase [Paenibacillus phyllosphaerae]|uniref:Probable 2-phosphosulfolactate phosphatase n=1 Tax=Paenibacillus phyllosphaerae TaxID=274593 RepID=A0A7W5FLH0_9BACL|nr:2-phosphosulfolactate phosphatase [Paenibacillus phyllosphaerae]MBB3109166.1 2-phosphosulfolactate phosphatase [Paenibacillus phyllosphaerae]
MHIEVISTVNEAREGRLAQRTAIVIDVLRATSTIVTALEAGACGVVPVETVLEARALGRSGDLLAGERFCRKIAGFELGNSPYEFTPEVVRNRRVVLTTTNGTRALHKSLRADHVLAGCLMNATACAKAAAELRRDVVLLCAGSHDEFALEDGLCAGLIISKIKSFCGQNVETDDFGTAMHGFYQHAQHNVVGTLLSGTTGKRLIKLGCSRDVERCAQIDCSQAVPRLQGDTLQLS